jgi:hypothetical protein
VSAYISRLILPSKLLTRSHPMLPGAPSHHHPYSVCVYIERVDCLEFLPRAYKNGPTLEVHTIHCGSLITMSECELAKRLTARIRGSRSPTDSVRAVCKAAMDMMFLIKRQKSRTRHAHRQSHVAVCVIKYKLIR